jgi:flagellar hook assembly protein FlgD
MRLSSPVITPNADGINDEIEIVYDLLNLTRTEPATVEVYDLAGRRLGAIRAGVAESGRFSTVWNGRDDLGNVLPPGLYIIRLMVETDNGTVAKQRTVSLAY